MKFRSAAVFSEKEVYGRALIIKSENKGEKDTLIAGYHLMALLYKDERVLMYCDSIIALTEKSVDILYPASAYLIKGNFYYDKRAFKAALDNYINANDYAMQYDNKNLIFKSRYAISILKDRIGQSEEAIQWHRENFAYAKQYIDVLNKKDYLSSVFALASTFNDLKTLDSAAFYNSYGIRESLRLKNQRKYHHFVLNSGVTNYYRKNYKNALDSIRKALPYFGNIDNKPNMAVGYFYLGKLYFEFDKEEEAISYLKKVDTVFQQSKDVLPKIRESYELLKNYYKAKNDPERQLHYVEQLIKLDSILHDNELYLSKNIIEEYQIPRLTAEKEAIINAMSKKEDRAWLITIIVSIVLLITVLLLYYLYRKIKLYKQQAETLISEQHVQLKSMGKSSNKKSAIGISEEIVNGILSSLETFENKRGYLNPGISIQMLAKKLQTNANYLSKVINYHKNLSFTHYINQLRIEYAVNELKTNTLYGKFTIEAIANEFGFNRRDAFSRAFYKHTGTKPSYFMKRLHK